MERMHVWIIEAQHVNKPGSRWTPVPRFGLGKDTIRGAHITRFMARKAAKRMQAENMHNKPNLMVRSRVRKYQAAYRRIT